MQKLCEISDKLKTFSDENEDVLKLVYETIIDLEEHLDDIRKGHYDKVHTESSRLELMQTVVDNIDSLICTKDFLENISAVKEGISLCQQHHNETN